MALSSDGRFAVLAGKDKALWYWDLQTATGRAHRLRTGGADVTAIALSPDNQLVAYVSGGAIRFCDTITKTRSKKKAFNEIMGSGINLIAFSPDGRLPGSYGQSRVRGFFTRWPAHGLFGRCGRH